VLIAPHHKPTPPLCESNSELVTRNIDPSLLCVSPLFPFGCAREGGFDFDRLPAGEGVAAQGKVLPSHDPFVMRGGYREFEGSLVPPWSVSKAPTKKACLGFLEAAEASAAAARQGLRGEYGDKWADKLFGSGGGGDKDGAEKGIVRVSKDPDGALAARLAGVMLQPAPAKRRFTVAVTGQSNCAGHGSYFDET
jgi:hypothetical protein